MKKLLAFFLSILIVLTIFPIGMVVSAQDWVTEDGFTYCLNESNPNFITLTGYEGPDVSHLDIPAYIDGKPVITLGISAFREKTFKSVTIPNTVMYIRDSVFGKCANLDNVIIPDNVTVIGSYAFVDCTSLKNISIPQKIEIWSFAFKGCTSLTRLVLPESTTEISDGMFIGCTGLKDVVIPERITKIGSNAFQNCTSLESIILPERLDTLEGYVFSGCTSLKSIEVPEGIKWISDGCFDGCSSMKSITLHADGLPNLEWDLIAQRYSIGRGAFNGCTALKDLYWYGTQERWDTVIWSDEDDPLKKATLHMLKPNIPANMNYSIDKEAKCVTILDYYGTEEEVIVPVKIEGYTVTTVDYAAFSGSKEVKRITLPETVTELAKAAFSGCTNLESVNIPNNITIIREKTFSSCSSLKSINIHDGITYIASEAFVNCASLENVVVPNSVTTIESNAFASCKSLKSIVLPTKLAKIEAMLFMNCNSLESIIIPEGVTKLDTYAFYKCGSLKTIILPASLVKIDQSTFINCDSLTDVYYTGTTEDWNKIVIGYDNEALSNAMLHTHTHNWQFSKISRETTCSREGEKLYICSCGGQKTESIAKIPHTEVIDKAVDATCTSAGLTEGKHCSVCNETIIAQQTVEMLPHEYDNDCDAICNVCYKTRSVDGHKYDNDCDAVCNNCQSVRNIEGHKYDNDCDTTCDKCGNVRPFEGHKYTNNCDAVCDSCGFERVVTGHQFEWIIDDEANCKWEGSKHEECSLCHTKRNENTVIPASGKHVYNNDCDSSCNVCFTTRTVSHNYEWVIDKPATCSTAGKKHEECTLCGQKKILSTTIPATGKHTYLFSCSSTCSECGEYRSAANHKYEWIIDKPATCSTAGKKHEECSICHTMRNIGTQIPLTGKHVYENNCDATCDECGKIRTVNHSYAPATCSSPKTCRICGVTSGNALSHTYKTTLTKATLSKNGKSVKKCSSCGDISTTVIAKIASVKLSDTVYTYNGKAKTPTITVKDSTGKKISSSNYTVKLASGRKNVGKYKVTVTFKGNYSGTKTLYFTINPVKTTVSKLTPGKKSIKVNVTKKTSQVTGYQIQYSTSKTFKSSKTKTISSYKTTSATIKSLSAKKTYYVRVRTYKTVSGVKYYSGWSVYKYTKTK